MGNKASLSGGDSSDLEYNSAKRLLLSIKLNSKEQTEEAIELARKECVKPSRVFASVFSYDDMVKKMHEYLTKLYSIEIQDNKVTRTMSPLEYAILIHSNESAQVITNAITDLTKSMKAKEKQSSQTISQTKETLKNRQTEYDYTSKGLQPLPKENPKQEKVSIKQMMKNSNNPDRALEAKMKLKAFQDTRTKK
jgi:hypothetical protein